MLFGQYSYYVLGDPFVYITLLFPIECLETLYSILIVLRMYCVGLVFIAYCRYQKKETINSLLGAIIYTFCGFILYAGIRHPYFTNAVILLPLNFIGIEKLLRENKKSFLIFIVFFSAVSNYYFFYMITIINMIYAIVKYIFEYNQGIKEFLKKVLTAVGCYIVGILMASIILLPTAYAFLNSARTGYEQTWQYSPGFYRNFLMGLISMRFNNWTVISVASIILLMLPVLVTKVKEKEVRTYATLFLITTGMLMIPFIGSIMNGFSFPSNRWVFAYSFILAYIVVICFDKQLQYSKRQIIMMAIFLIIYCIGGIWITKLKIKTNLDFYISLSIAILIWVVIFLNHINSKFSKRPLKILNYSYVLVIFLVLCNIWVISLGLYCKDGKGYVEEFLDNNSAMQLSNTSNGKISHFKEAIEYIKENDKGFYRIAKCDTTNQNLSLLYDYHSIQSFLSIGNGNIYELSSKLEDNHYSTTTCINGMDRRTKILTLLGTKYYICSSKDICYVPYGYQLYHKIGNTEIYINENYLPIGIMYDNYILEEEYDKLSPLKKEEALLNSAVLKENTDVIKKSEDEYSKIDQIVNVDYIEKDGLIKDNTIKITKKNQSIYLKLNEVKPNTELYLSIRNLNYDSGIRKTDFKITTSFNGIKDSEKVEDQLSSAYYVRNPNFLINLGVIRGKIKDEVKITFNNKGTYTFNQLEILAVPMKTYEDKIQKLKQNEMTDIVYGNDFISGHVRNESNSILQITTSYSDGWRVWVDGKETKVIKVNDGFIGVLLEAGEHEIKFVYRTPYLNLGIVFSIIGMVCFICIFAFERKKKIVDKE